MTNQAIDAVIADAERKAWNGAFAAPIAGGVLTTIFSIAAFTSDFYALWMFCSVVFALTSVGSLIANRPNFNRYQHNKAREIWKSLGRDNIFGARLSEATRRLGNEVQNIYNGESSGKLLPLHQAIQLVDTHNRQQQRLAIVENRLNELRGLQKNLSSKLMQLRELGEDYPQGARNLEQIGADLEALGRVHGQIYASCTRLEAIVIGVQKALQSRQLRAELEGLSARVAPSSGAIEPAFETESLEHIERQIGREIETYLRLERETDEHLR